MKSPNFIILKRNMEGMLRYSQQEYQEFKRTRDVILLQQAGEKLFNAVENLIALKYEIRAESFYELKNLVGRDARLRELLYDARELHRFFYNGEADYDAADAEKRYIKVLKRLKTSMSEVGR